MNQDPLRAPPGHLPTEPDRVPPPEAADPVLAGVRHATSALLAQTTTAPTVVPHPSFREQLGIAMDRFEVLHPTLAAAITQVIDIRERLGGRFSSADELCAYTVLSPDRVDHLRDLMLFSRPPPPCSA